MKEDLEQKDLDLAAARKTAREKTDLADKKLASVGKLEEEHTKLKTVIGEANEEVVQVKKDKVARTNKVANLTRKRDELEAYPGGLAKKMFLMLEGTFPCPTDLHLPTHHTTVNSSFSVCAEFSKFRGRDWAD